MVCQIIEGSHTEIASVKQRRKLKEEMRGVPSYWYLYVEYLNEILLLEVMWTLVILMGNFEAMKIHTESKTFTALCSFSLLV